MLLGVLLLPVGTSLRAQPAPAPANAAPKPKSAYVRFWNMLPANTATTGGGELELVNGTSQSLTASPPGNYYAAYQPVPPTAYTFVVRRPADPDNPVGRLAPVSLRADNYVTVLVSEKDGRPTAELLNDTPDPKAPPDLPGKVVVRHFFPGARVAVVADRRQNSGELQYGETRALEGLPARVVPLAMQTIATAGVPAKTWNTEVDFSGPVRRATLLVVADPYGRFRPRLAYDGPEPETPAPVADGSPGTAPAAPRPTGTPAPAPPPNR